MELRKERVKSNVVNVPLEIILLAAVDVLGENVEEKRENDEIILTAKSSICPPLIKIRRVGEDTYEVITTSRCDIKDCTYWERCARLDGERQSLLVKTINELAERTAATFKLLRWTPERVDEISLAKVIDRITSRGELLPTVVKRDKSVEEFMTEKITISCLKAGAPLTVAREIAHIVAAAVKGKSRVSSGEIREIVVSELRKRNPKWEENWIKFEKTVKKV
ncbi:MAG: ATP cone domain-containing protein [Candidatus Nezhaarchaeales archaeon]